MRSIMNVYIYLCNVIRIENGIVLRNSTQHKVNLCTRSTLSVQRVIDNRALHVITASN